jgi:hypothetical protein
VENLAIIIVLRKEPNFVVYFIEVMAGYKKWL